MPAVLSTFKIKPRPPKIHVHVREKAGESKKVDMDFTAISTVYSANLGLFGSSQITQVNITPPATFDFLRGVELNREMSCINCSTRGYPHLDPAISRTSLIKSISAGTAGATAHGVRSPSSRHR